MLSRKKLEIWGIQTAGNTFKTVNAYTTTLFLCHFKSFTIASGGPYGSWEGGGGGGGVRALPAHFLPTGLNKKI